MRAVLEYAAPILLGVKDAEAAKKEYHDNVSQLLWL